MHIMCTVIYDYLNGSTGESINENDQDEIIDAVYTYAINPETKLTKSCL